MGLRQFGSYFTGVDGLTTRGEMHIRAGGYVGIAPLGHGAANVCVVRFLRRGVTLRRAGPESPPHDCLGSIMTSVIDDDSELRARFERAHRVSPVVALGPLAVEAAAAGLPGLLLAGDAAGFVDPMTGDGLRFALRGGELAARAALAELTAGHPAHLELGAALRREFAFKRRFNRALRALVASHRAVTCAERLASRWQAPFRALVDFAGDVRLAGVKTGSDSSDGP